MLLTLRLCLAALLTASATSPASAISPALTCIAASACNHGTDAGQLRPLQLLHFSDLHGSALHLQRIVEYMDSHDVDDAIHTGDGVMCYYDDENVFESVPGGRRILNTIGNHDCWKGHLLWSQTDKPYDATKEEAYSRFFVGPDPQHPTISGWGVCQPAGVNDAQSPDYQACYYYKDYPCSATRLIVLDCIHYDDAQADWFTATLASAREAGLAVITVTHYPAEFGMVPFDPALTPDGMDYPASSNPGAVQIESMPDCAFDPVDKFIDEGGTFVCWLSGHNHNDYVGYVKNHGRQLQILVDKAGELDRYMLDSDRSGENADAFNLVTYDPVSKQLTVQRVGCADGYHGKRGFTSSAVSR